MESKNHSELENNSRNDNIAILNSLYQTLPETIALYLQYDIDTLLDFESQGNEAAYDMLAYSEYDIRKLKNLAKKNKAIASILTYINYDDETLLLLAGYDKSKNKIRYFNIDEVAYSIVNSPYKENFFTIFRDIKSEENDF